MYQSNILQDETVLITGGASGIGYAIAKYCIDLGAKVIIASRNQEALEHAAKELGKQAYIQVLDLRKTEQISHVVDELVSKHQISVLINNAAANFLCPSEQISSHGYSAIVETVMQGSFLLTQALGKHWIAKQQSAKVISISAFYAAHAGPYVTASAMAKSAIESMTKSLAVEWGRYGIRCNAISPGYVMTEGAWKRLLPPGFDIDAMLSSIPLARLGEPEEIAQAVVFMVLHSYVTGQVLLVDGGVQLATGAGVFYEMPQQMDSDDWQRMRKQSQSKDNQ